MAYATRRLSSILVVAGAVIGIVSVTMLERLGMPLPGALAIGFLLFAATATSATNVAARGTAAVSEDAGRTTRGEPVTRSTS
jgi:hypothetical protein